MKIIIGSNNFDEIEFQELFQLYWNADEGSKERTFVIEELNKYLYFYAINRFQNEFDTASDFFLENINNTRKWLEEYEPAFLISFLIYFTSRIKRRFFNYRGKINKQKSYENIHEFYNMNPDTFAESVFESKKSYSGKNQTHYSEFMNKCLSELKHDEEIAIKLYYGFTLSRRDFRFLINRRGLTKVFENYRKYQDHLRSKLASEQMLRESISHKLYITNIKMRDVFSENMCLKQKRLLTTFGSVKNLVPLRLIAEIFQTNITNISRKIRRAKKKLQGMLDNQKFIDFENQVEHCNISSAGIKHARKAA